MSEENVDLVEKIKNMDEKLDELKKVVLNLSAMIQSISSISSNEEIEKIKEADNAIKSLNSSMETLNRRLGV